MNSEENLSTTPAEDRAALREELLRSESGDSDRLRVFDALNREADDDADVPEMPEGLRGELVERFGERAPRLVESTAPRLGLMEVIGAFFKTNPLAGYGGLAAAACAVMFMIFQTGDPQEVGNDRLRGGGDGVAVTADVPVFLFPAVKADSVQSMMAEGREVSVLADAGAVEGELPDGAAVAVDLDRRMVMIFQSGELVDETRVAGDGARGVLLGIRAALDGLAK